MSFLQSLHRHLSWSLRHFEVKNSISDGVEQSLNSGLCFFLFQTKVHHKNTKTGGLVARTGGDVPNTPPIQIQQSLSGQQWILSDLCSGHCLFLNRHLWPNNKSNSLSKHWGRTPVMVEYQWHICIFHWTEGISAITPGSLGCCMFWTVEGANQRQAFAQRCCFFFGLFFQKKIEKGSPLK